MIRLLTGDCRKVLKDLEDESVHCCVTSPPYWGLRDYGVDGQLGMEKSLGEYIEVMVAVFREVHRVLRKDGTLWLNLGDSYATSPNGRTAAEVKALGNDDRTFRDKPFSTIGAIYNPDAPARWPIGSKGNKSNSHSGLGGRIEAGGYLKPKDICGIPWRVAFALQADGWYLRQDIIWSKPNPMPESVTDRCTKAHEYIFLLSKSTRYFYDAEAIAENAINAGRLVEYNGDQKNCETIGDPRFATRITSDRLVAATRNKRSVWEVATQPYSEAHFATFPPALIEPCIKAGCPKGGTVLDPFGGAGTTGMVADRLKRNAVLIELNPKYASMAHDRLRNDAGMFAEIEGWTLGANYQTIAWIGFVSTLCLSHGYLSMFTNAPIIWIC